MNREGISIPPSDQILISNQLIRESKISWLEKRLKAMVIFSWTSAIRLGELLSLDIEDICQKRGKNYRINEVFFIREKAKRFPSGNRATGKVHVSRSTREAIRAYLNAAIDYGVIEIPLRDDQPIWVSTWKKRLNKRTLQKNWHSLQRRAGIPEFRAYRWHDLRHTALTEIGEIGEVFDVRALGRFRTMKNTIRYVHPSDEHIVELMDRVDRKKCRKK